MDRFAFLEANLGFSRHGDCLFPPAHQMHLDAALSGIPNRAVIEMFRVEVGIELTIQANQQVLVERRGNAPRIVVSGDQYSGRLREVGADDQAGRVPKKRTRVP
jgi:hypothetical protein